MADERGVSEVLGFVLVASLILSTIGVVYVAGMGGLQEARDAERLQNAERAFDVFADNVEDLRARGAPSRATEIKLADAQLDYGEPTTIFVNVTENGTGTPVASATKALGPIRYSAGSSSRIVYENGAVIRVDRSGARMKVPPSFVFIDHGQRQTGVIPIMQTRQTGPGSVAGSTTVLVRADSAVREVLVSERSGIFDLNFTMVTTPSRAKVWADYLNRSSTIPDGLHQSGDTCDLDGGRVTCRLVLDRVTVTRIGVDVRFT